MNCYRNPSNVQSVVHFSLLKISTIVLYNLAKIMELALTEQTLSPAHAQLATLVVLVLS